MPNEREGVVEIGRPRTANETVSRGSAMSYVEKNLMPGETVVYRTRLHWIVIFWPIVLSIIFGVAGLVLLARTLAGPSDESGDKTAMLAGGAILLVVGIISLVVALLKRNATEMAVTDRRVIVKIGVAARRTFEILLSKVESI